MHVEDFYDLTPFEFANAIEGYEEARREDWEMQRLFTTALLQPQTKTKLTPQKIVQFPWDVESARGTMKIISGDVAKKILEQRKKKPS